MKKHSTTISLGFRASRSNLPRIIVAIALLSIVTGLFTATTDEMLAYMLISVACAIPCIVWVSVGTPGIPLLPPICCMFFIYYALPIFRRNSNLADFAPPEILDAAITVTLFLAAAIGPWWILLVRNSPTSPSDVADLFSGRRLIQVIFTGLVLGMLFYVALYEGWLSWLGPAYGLIRSAMMTMITAACFLLGHARAKGVLRANNWAIAVAFMSAIIFLNWMSLFLVFGLMVGAAAILGYVITKKQIPWKMLSAALPLIIVLHAGKEGMREKYWVPGSSANADQMSLSTMPSMMVEWIGNGLVAIGSQNDYRSAIDRASLLHVLLQVQRLTPDYIPFLGGTTYALLPEMLMPRFIDPEKTVSQAAMNMLNIRYGLLTAQETQSTAAGWGLVAEAFANFGLPGVILVGFFLGLLCGFVERWATGAALISLPSFCAVIIVMQLVNVEADAAELLTTLFQSIVSISSIYWVIQIVAKNRRRPPQRMPARNPQLL